MSLLSSWHLQFFMPSKMPSVLHGQSQGLPGHLDWTALLLPRGSAMPAVTASLNWYENLVKDLA